MNKHTPGPWYAYSLLSYGVHAGYQYGIANSKPCGIVQDEDGAWSPDFPDWNRDSRIIAKTTDSDTARDDARLIAEAPDMLKTLTDLVNAASTIENDDNYHKIMDEVKAARAAIARAEGSDSATR